MKITGRPLSASGVGTPSPLARYPRDANCAREGLRLACAHGRKASIDEPMYKYIAEWPPCDWP